MNPHSILILTRSNLEFEMLEFLINFYRPTRIQYITENTQDSDLLNAEPTVYGLNVTNKNAYDLFVAWMENHIGQPIIIIESQEFNWQAFMVDDNTYKGDMVDGFKEVKRILDLLEKPVQADPPKDYQDIKISTLEILGTLENDVYIELKTGRKLKIFNKGDHLNRDDIKKYQEKGINQLFFKYEGLGEGVEKIEKNLSGIIQKHYQKIVDDSNIKTETVTEIAKRIKETPSIITTNYLNDPVLFTFPFGLDKVHLYTLKQISKDIIETSLTQGMIGHHFIRLAQSKDHLEYIKKRIGHMVNILFAISKELEWDTRSVIERFVYASFIHDIALFEHFNLLKLQYNEECENVTGTDLELFHTHPEQACKLAQEDRFAPPNVDSILLQHHERLDGNGFPEGLNKHKIGPYSAAFIMAINFAQYILDFPNWNIKEYLLLIDAEYKGGNFVKPLHALESLCRTKF